LSRPTRRRRLALLLVLAVLGLALYFRPYEVQGRSMEPNYFDGDWVLSVPLWAAPERGELVIFDAPDGSGRSMKRIAGLPGESAQTIWQTLATQSGRAPIETSTTLWGSESEGPPDLPQGNYFLLGDHLADSIDSRHFGPVQHAVMGRRVVARLYAADRRASHGELAQ
jgi:signal peptidase I